MTLGLIGLGNIGFHFASRLLAAGEDLVVHDLSPSALSRVVSLGARAAESARQVACQAQTVLLCLPFPAIVKDVATGTGNVIDGTAVRVVLDLSTTGPSVTRDVAAALAAREITFLSAPVSGGTLAAEKGTLTVMAAGADDVFRKIEPLLRIIGKNVFYLGADPSLGQTMKLINNTLYATSMIASCEALVYGVKAGLDAPTMLNILNASSGRSFATLERIPQCVLDRSFPVRFTTELLLKDVKLCLEEAERLGAPMMVSPAARQFLAFAVTQGDGGRDNVHTIRHFEEWAGVCVGRAPDPS